MGTHQILHLTSESIAREWRTEAEKRRKVSRTDPVADTLEFCADELSVRMRDAAQAETWLTAEEYATDEGVTPATVRAWCRRRLLPHKVTPKGYKIRKGEVRLAHPYEEAAKRA